MNMQLHLEKEKTDKVISAVQEEIEEVKSQLASLPKSNSFSPPNFLNPNQA